MLDVGENAQKGISMHAAQYTTTPISRALKRAKKRAARTDKLATMPDRSSTASRPRLERPTNARVRTVGRVLGETKDDPE